MKKNPYIGRPVREDLKKDLRDAKFARAFRQAKSKLSLREQMKKLAEKEGVGIRELARRMKTSPAQVTRLFNSPSESWRLDTLIKFSAAVGKTIDISFR